MAENYETNGELKPNKSRCRLEEIKWEAYISLYQTLRDECPEFIEKLSPNYNKHEVC